MSRNKLSKNTERNILINGKRRCPLCYGLFRDFGVKKGQIAHIDKDSSNDSEENLLFLCLNHHDEYDSIRSQSKGITQKELEHYRDELYEAIKNNIFDDPTKNGIYLNDAMLEIVAIDIDEHNEDGYPIVDIKLRNLGNNAGFVKRIDINVVDCFKMNNPNLTDYSRVDCSHTYNTLLDIETNPKILRVSQSVPANSVDRFQIVLASNHYEPEIPWIYELSFKILYNSDSSVESDITYIVPVRANIDWAGSFTSGNSKKIAMNNYNNLKRFYEKSAIKSEHFMGIYASYLEVLEYCSVD